MTKYCLVNEMTAMCANTKRFEDERSRGEGDKNNSTQDEEGQTISKLHFHKVKQFLKALWEGMFPEEEYTRFRFSFRILFKPAELCWRVVALLLTPPSLSPQLRVNALST